MLAYLDTLSRWADRRFEEYFQYRHRLERFAEPASTIRSTLPAAIDDPGKGVALPALIGSTEAYNLVRYRDKAYGLPKPRAD